MPNLDQRSRSAAALASRRPLAGIRPAPRPAQPVVVSVQGPALLTGGGFGPEGSLLLSLLALPVALRLAVRKP